MSDLFSVSFLVFLGIIVLAIALLVLYFESKSREQNHKIASMFSVVSTLAEDLNNVKMGLNQLAFNGFNGGGPSLAENMHPFKENNHLDDLIEVSDDDSEDELEDELEDDSDYESDYESDDEPVNVKVLKIEDPLLEKVEQNFDELEQKFDNLEDLDENLDSEYDQDTFEEESLQLVENDFVPEEIPKNEKSIKIDLGEVVNDVIDYKKLTLQKLKTIVAEKGLATDTSKLKKPDLLKLLGIE